MPCCTVGYGTNGTVHYIQGTLRSHEQFCVARKCEVKQTLCKRALLKIQKRPCVRQNMYCTRVEHGEERMKRATPMIKRSNGNSISVVRINMRHF